MLKDLVTAFLSLKSKVWSIPKPGSFGQVVFLVGLQSLQVCARTGASRADAPTSIVEKCIVNFCGKRDEIRELGCCYCWLWWCSLRPKRSSEVDSKDRGLSQGRSCDRERDRIESRKEWKVHECLHQSWGEVMMVRDGNSTTKRKDGLS